MSQRKIQLWSISRSVRLRPETNLQAASIASHMCSSLQRSCGDTLNFSLSGYFITEISTEIFSSS
jgi:hypothetical protein